MAENWREQACNILRTYYQSFGGTQWHEFNTCTDSELLKIKICYAIFGLPTNVEATTVEEAYSEEQKSRAQEIINNLLKVERDDKSSINIGFAFVVCHEQHQENVFCIPVFSVLVGSRRGQDKRNFVDTFGRTYKNWDDWKTTNCLPKVEIAYPEDGYFTCNKDGSYGFDSEIDPVIEFGESPQCSSWSAVKNAGDAVTAVTSLGCAAVGIASLFTPLAPVVLGTSAVVGGTSASYGAARGIGALIDKGTHGQSLKDLESLTLWFSIVATPFHFASSAVTGVLAKGAVQQGRIFSQGMRVFASVVLCTTFSLDTALITLGLFNLIKKAKDRELTTLDVLQFSISVFFFSNTLIQPKTANGVIRKAQSVHFDKIANSMTDETAKKTFDKFLETNRVDGSITDRSKIVRTVNRMDDPNKFFKTAGSDQSIDSIRIGGRKGKTVFINDQHGYGQRVKPNEFQVINTDIRNPRDPMAVAAITNKLQKDVEKTVRNCYGIEPSEIELNGERIFENLDNLKKRNVSRKLGGTARNNGTIVTTAHGIAEEMGFNTIDEYLNIVEIVAREVQGIHVDDIEAVLNNLDRNAFIQELLADLARAEVIANNGDLTFQDPLKAVYHYRKHGEEFPRIIHRHGNSLDVYLGPVKNSVIDRSNLRQTIRLENGHMKYIYATMTDEYAIVISNPDGGSISTIFKYPGCSAKNPRQIFPTTSDPPVSITQETVPEAAKLVATNLGLPAFHVTVTTGGMKKDLSDCDELSEADHASIADLLMSFNNAL